MKVKAWKQVRIHPEVYQRIKKLNRSYRLQSITRLVDELLCRGLDTIAQEDRLIAEHSKHPPAPDVDPNKMDALPKYKNK